MKKQCPECNSKSVDTGFFDSNNEPHCSNCFARFEYGEKYKGMDVLIYLVIIHVAIFAGVYFQSWFVFFAVLIGMVLIPILLIKNPKQLMLVGLKAKLKNGL